MKHISICHENLWWPIWESLLWRFLSAVNWFCLWTIHDIIKSDTKIQAISQRDESNKYIQILSPYLPQRAWRWTCCHWSWWCRQHHVLALPRGFSRYECSHLWWTRTHHPRWWLHCPSARWQGRPVWTPRTRSWPSPLPGSQCQSGDEWYALEILRNRNFFVEDNYNICLCYICINFHNSKSINYLCHFEKKWVSTETYSSVPPSPRKEKKAHSSQIQVHLQRKHC